MTCKKCGCEVATHAKFCSSCGALCEKTRVNEENPKKFKLGKKAVVAIATVVVIAIVAVVFGLNAKPVIDLNRYVEIEVDGFDGYGCAKVNFDYAAFTEDFRDKIEYSAKSDIADQLSLVYESPSTAFLENCVIGTLTAEKNLSNGDTLEYKWDCDTELIEEVFKVKIKCKDISIELKDLKEVQEIDITPYLTIQANGYNGYGNATVSFDYAAFTDDYQDIIEYNHVYFEDDRFIDSYENAAQCLSQYYINGISLSENTGLKNGDTVELLWSCNDETILEAFGVRLHHDNMKCVIEGLQELEIVNLFHYITVTFSGVEGNGKVNVSIDRSVEFMEMVEVDVSGDYHIVNGSTIALEIEQHYMFIDNPTHFAEDYGVKPVSYKKEYTVSGLLEYASSVDQISENALEMMKSQTESMIEDLVANWRNPETCKGMEYVGTLLLKHKDIENMVSGNKNEIYIIYNIAVTDVNGDSFTYYFATRFSNVYCQEDGTCVVDVSTAYRGLASFSRWQNSTMLVYYGYKTWDDVINQLVPGTGSNYRYDATFDVT